MNIRPLVKLLVNRPKTVFFVFIIFTVLVSIQATNIYMQSDLTEFLPEDDPTIQLW